MGVTHLEGRDHLLKGRKQSPEHIAKRTARLRENGTYAKFSERTRQANIGRTGIPRTEEHKRKISESMKGKQNCLGLKVPEEVRRKISAYWIANREKLNHYIDGKGAERNGLRQAHMKGLEYRLWRQAVLIRDAWTCQFCGLRGGRLHVDHIQPYSLFPDLRCEVSNGRTLCVPCHRGTDTYGRKVHRKAIPT
jgi:5-methylcytosine-specific restriction endonuclease McrA